MPQPNFQGAPVISQTDSVIRDKNGEEILRIGAGEFTICYPDGRIERHKVSTNIILTDGTNFNVGMMYANPPVQVGVCSLCRHPPYSFPIRQAASHGLVRLTRARTCTCGTLCCVRHCKLCTDGRFRCLRCARKWSWKEVISRVFFAKE
ncbi:MAG: hypothetical protein PVI86_19400 [Phycisphaerae bacterium]|jgi:hypothetical protein